MIDTLPSSAKPIGGSDETRSLSCSMWSRGRSRLSGMGSIRPGASASGRFEALQEPAAGTRVAGAAGRSPLIEELQWIDTETQGVPRQRSSALSSSPAHCYCLTCRPEYRPGWAGARRALHRSKGWCSRSRHPAPRCSSTPFSGTKMRSLAPLKRLLIARTEGNPFFLEESVRTLRRDRRARRSAHERVPACPRAFNDDPDPRYRARGAGCSDRPTRHAESESDCSRRLRSSDAMWSCLVPPGR